MSLSLLSSQRIYKPSHFESLIKKGKFFRGKLLNAWINMKGEVCPRAARPMIAVMISRKVAQRANKRNLWKRRIKEAFRRNQKEIKRGVAVLIQGRKVNDPPPYREIEKELIYFLKKAKAWEKIEGRS